ncbi:LeuA family protein [Desulfonatronovibrio hydrogenovorans]|uniref:LeuA family protein n=1 Tax=Desulfonatronovibrio hydrogenovorans TaxID=53245 RepID=UPI0006913D19|nr:LeuA family protein [Desulfonatronovibrio hydrogenovorans]
MLIDTTLREGEQRFGLYLGNQARLRILNLLIKMGVDEVEVGLAGEDSQLRELINYTAAFDLKPEISVWAPFRVKHLIMADALGPDIINTALPVSDLHIEKRLGLNRNTLLQRLEQTLSQAGEMTARISLGLEDVSRADPTFALDTARMARDLGVWRIRLSDSVGLFEPTSAGRIIAGFKKSLNMPLAFHGHNDFGMATANAVSALSAGCDYSDVSVLGIGERSGIARLEEVLAWLVFRTDHQKYDLTWLPGLSDLVADLAGIRIDEHRPIVGSKIFHVESGLHADALYKNPELFEPFAPEQLDLKRKIQLGAKSGKSAVQGKLKELFMDYDPGRLEALVSVVRQEAGLRRAPLSDTSFKRICREVERPPAKDLTLKNPLIIQDVQADESDLNAFSCPSGKSCRALAETSRSKA